VIESVARDMARMQSVAKREKVVKDVLRVINGILFKEKAP